MFFYRGPQNSFYPGPPNSLTRLCIEYWKRPINFQSKRSKRPNGNPADNLMILIASSFVIVFGAVDKWRHEDGVKGGLKCYELNVLLSTSLTGFINQT
jgi:hypothetical protein